jgi:protein-tyrosine phosphatase
VKLLSVVATATLSVALVGAPVSVSVAQTPPSAVPAAAAAAPKLTSIWNFRDVAGTGLPLSGGATMTTGVVYRSGQLHGLSDADLLTLQKDLGITAIYDLRSKGAAKATPDRAIAGAPATVFDVFAGHNKAYKGKTAAGARAYMRSMNRQFVTDAAQRKNIARVLRAIAGATGPVLIHCAAGKDRTGWVSAVLQQIAGASRNTIVSEYKLSNAYRKDLIKKRVADALRTSGARKAGIVKELEFNRRSYIEAGLNKASSKYGSFHRYLTRGLKLSDATIATLRAKLRQA